jgi:hypothetical protein
LRAQLRIQALDVNASKFLHDHVADMRQDMQPQQFAVALESLGALRADAIGQTAGLTLQTIFELSG